MHHIPLGIPQLAAIAQRRGVHSSSMRAGTFVPPVINTRIPTDRLGRMVEYCPCGHRTFVERRSGKRDAPQEPTQ